MREGIKKVRAVKVERRTPSSAALLPRTFACAQGKLRPGLHSLRYFMAATLLTSIVLSFSVPVTVTLAPACLSSVSSAALSVVSSV